MASSINASTSGGGGVIVSSDATGDLNLQSGATTVVAVTSTGVAVTGTLSSSGASTFTGTGKFATTIGVGNATPAASGAGITFPATQSASSDANTLDDYEEGTFTPSPAFGGVSTGMTFDTNPSLGGTYVKIGRVVYIDISIPFLSNGTGTGNFTIGGLPFTPTNSTTNYTSLSITIGAATGTVGGINARIQKNSTTISELTYSNTGTNSYLTDTKLVDYSNAQVSGFYYI
jgi:hypothetical protein